MTEIFRLKGAIKNYDWGGYDFLPQLLKLSNEEKKPFAEYWLGIHGSGIAIVDSPEGSKLLTEYTNDLPFLLKVLDVRDMLSIQVHPSLEKARAGFEAENERGIPTDAPERNYKDANHKPELAIALDDFWLLHGFKEPEELTYTLLNVVELRELLPIYNNDGYMGLYRYVMDMAQEDVNRICQPLLDNLREVYGPTPPAKNDEDYWVYKAAQLFNNGGDIDRGIFSIYLFNLVHLKKGEAIFQDAGVPHAYLEGKVVEIMSNSDNVLRGGLTKKHIAVVELLRNVKYEATFPDVILPVEAGEHEKKYPVPVANFSDFEISCIQLEAGDTVSIEPSGTEILLLTEGRVEVDNDNDMVLLAEGQPSALLSGTDTVYIAAARSSLLFRATGYAHTVKG